MGKPRMIILIRHGQSEGNKNRDIHQFIPDHRVKLTPNGHSQAEEAGRRLRDMLRPDDSITFFTSPYRRTRETTEGILKSLTCDDPKPSPFPRHMIKVYEEPRLREQDFGNFQPCSAEMERMWQERADYGHFFYRIPNGESAADAYDRVSGFNESLWRQFGDADFPSVCVLVTHGLMTRVFLMKWYHWSVEYFEDLRNVNHCEFVIMNQKENGKYKLDTQLRTWSELQARAAAANGVTASDSTQSPTTSKQSQAGGESPTDVPGRKWGGCADGCNHAHSKFPRRVKRQNTADLVRVTTPTSPKTITGLPKVVSTGASASVVAVKSTDSISKEANKKHSQHLAAGSPDADDVLSSEGENVPRPRSKLLHLGRDFGGSHSGVGTPAEGLSDDSDYFNPRAVILSKPNRSKSNLRVRQESIKSLQDWADESGMGAGKMADKLGDGDEETDSSAQSPPAQDSPEDLTMKGKSSKQDKGSVGTGNGTDGEPIESIVERMKDRDRKSMREVY